MTVFIDQSLILQRFLCIVLFLLSWLHLTAAIFRHYLRPQRSWLLLNAAIFLLQVYALAVMHAALTRGTGLRGVMPVILILALFIAALDIRSFTTVRSASKNELSPRSVKEALDDLGTGVCFADGSGRIVLINRAMVRFAAALNGRIPRTVKELKRYVEADNVSLGGSVFSFREAPLRSSELPGYTQITAQDITELYRANEQLSLENETLKRTNDELREVYDRLSDSIRKQESMALKMQVHNEIGISLIEISDIMRRGSGDTDAWLERLQRAVSYFSSGRGDAELSWTSVCRKAEEIGVEVLVSGELPPEPALKLLLYAVREAATNCVRHAGGHRLNVTVTKDIDFYHFIISNDGKAPAGPVREGGGLSDLRRRVEACGGSMRTEWDPEYLLSVNVPLPKEQ